MDDMERADLPDYYEVLQVSRQADPIIITKAYRVLAALYHPDNKDTADEAAFKTVVDAYRVLSDPVRRAAFHREKFGKSALAGNGRANGHGAEGAAAGRRAGDERQLRTSLLQTLYDRRRSRPAKPGLSLWVLSELLGCSIEAMQFTLWYLRAKKLLEVLDEDELAITVAGVDYVESNGLDVTVDPTEPLSLPPSTLSLDARNAGDPPER